MGDAASPTERARTIDAQMPYLSAEQQSLLLAALSSNKRSAANKSRLSLNQKAASLGTLGTTPNQESAATDGIDPSLFKTTSHSVSPTGTGFNTFGDSLFPDHSTNFDVDYTVSGIDFFNESPDLNESFYDGTNGGDPTEKRKSPEEDESDDEEGDSKRQEGDDKVAKKPGRKMITAEPTTKRKAQNRAAQRAFRERKEKHLRDLELKVNELETKLNPVEQENGILKAQVDRLQNELREYRKRLSSNGTGLGTSPPTSIITYGQQGSTTGSPADFQFDFARFGAAAPTQYASNGQTSTSRSSISRLASRNGRSTSPKSNASNNTLANISNPAQADVFSGFFNGLTGVPDTSLVPQAAASSATTSESDGGKGHQSSISSYMSDSNSPAASAASQNGVSSSCCTSPEANQTYINDRPKTNGNSTHGVDETLTEGTPTLAPAYDFTNFDWLANQNGGQFDPVLFGDYRESQDAIVGGGDFSSGFFEDPYDLHNLGTNDFSFDINAASNNLAAFNNKPMTAPAAKDAITSTVGKSLMDQVARCRNGETAHDDKLVMPGDTEKYMMTANTIWSELQKCPAFISGDLDIDSLCTELSQKAKCSETGMAVPKDVVEQALWRLAGVPGGNAEDATRTKAEQNNAMLVKLAAQGTKAE